MDDFENAYEKFMNGSDPETVPRKRRRKTKKIIKPVKDFTISSKEVDLNNTSECSFCKKEIIFNFRDKESIEKCDCLYNLPNTVWDFVKFLKDRNLLTMIIDKHGCPTIDGVIQRLRNTDINEVNDKFYSKEYYRDISIFTYNVCKKYVKRWRVTDLLEIGSNNMIFVREFSKPFKVNPQSLDVTTNDVLVYENNKEIFQEFDGTLIPYEELSLRFVFVNKFLHHLEFPELFIESIFKSLKYGGILILYEYDCRNWKQAYSLNSFHLYLGKIMNDDNGSPSYRSINSWRELIEKQGFETLIEETRYEKPVIYNAYFEFYRKPFEE